MAVAQRVAIAALVGACLVLPGALGDYAPSPVQYAQPRGITYTTTHAAPGYSTRATAPVFAHPRAQAYTAHPQPAKHEAPYNPNAPLAYPTEQSETPYENPRFPSYRKVVYEKHPHGEPVLSKARHPVPAYGPHPQATNEPVAYSAHNYPKNVPVAYPVPKHAPTLYRAPPYPEAHPGHPNARHPTQPQRFQQAVLVDPGALGYTASAPGEAPRYSTHGTRTSFAVGGRGAAAAGYTPHHVVGDAPAPGAGSALDYGPVKHASPLDYSPVKQASPVNYALVKHAPVTDYAPVKHAAVEDYPSAPAKYEYAYDIHDEVTGDIHSQHESRDGDVVHGSYSLLDPDGTRRTVEYTADALHGFNAVVHREPAVVHRHGAPAGALNHVSAAYAKVAAAVQPPAYVGQHVGQHVDPAAHRTGYVAATAPASPAQAYQR